MVSYYKRRTSKSLMYLVLVGTRVLLVPVVHLAFAPPLLGVARVPAVLQGLWRRQIHSVLRMIFICHKIQRVKSIWNAREGLLSHNTCWLDDSTGLV